MTGQWQTFRFRSVWRRLPAPPARVYAVLERAEDYPSWWPQIREVAGDDARSGVVRFRSVLPFVLRVTLSAERRDPGAGVLEVRMAGDLRGWVRCTVRPDPGGGSRVFFEQYSEVHRPRLGPLALLARPFLRLNHALMMRAGHRGLSAHLAGRTETSGGARSLDEE